MFDYLSFSYLCSRYIQECNETRRYRVSVVHKVYKKIGKFGRCWSIRPNIYPVFKSRRVRVLYSDLDPAQGNALHFSQQTWISNQNVFVLHKHPPPLASAFSETQGALVVIGNQPFGSHESLMRCRETFDCEIDQPNSLRRSIDNSE